MRIGSITVEPQRVAVVGNGTLSESARSEIRRRDIVARFNKMETLEPGEPLSIQYLRFDPDSMSFHGLSEARRHSAPTVALVYEPKYVDALKTPMLLLKDRQLLHVYEEFKGIHYPGDHQPYPPFSDRNRKVPSTGYFGIHHLMASFPSALLELFGFTWQGWRWHDWDFEKKEILKYQQTGRLTVHSK